MVWPEARIPGALGEPPGVSRSPLTVRSGGRFVGQHQSSCTGRLSQRGHRVPAYHREADEIGLTPEQQRDADCAGLGRRTVPVVPVVPDGVFG
jgi:hypothetical protein